MFRGNLMHGTGRYSSTFNCLRSCLTHWGRVTHICVIKLTIIGSDNGLSPGRRQAIIWANVGILLIGPLGTNFSENLVEIVPFSFTKMRLRVSPAKCRPFCLGLNVLIHQPVGDVVVIVISKHVLQIEFITICEIVVRWMSQNNNLTEFGIIDNKNSPTAYVTLYELIDTRFLDSNKRVGVWSLPWRWHILSIPLTTGRGKGTETCGLDDVFHPDDLCSRPEALC